MNYQCEKNIKGRYTQQPLFPTESDLEQGGLVLNSRSPAAKFSSSLALIYTAGGPSRTELRDLKPAAVEVLRNPIDMR